MKKRENSVIVTTIKHFNYIQAFINKMNYFKVMVVIKIKVKTKNYCYI